MYVAVELYIETHIHVRTHTYIHVNIFTKLWLYNEVSTLFSCKVVHPFVRYCISFEKERIVLLLDWLPEKTKKLNLFRG